MSLKFPSLKKITGYVHLWLGLTSGLVVFVVSLTGAILTFEDELEIYLVSRDQNIVTPSSTQPLPLDTLMHIGTPELLKLKHGNRATRIFVYSDPTRSAIVGYNREDTDSVKWPYTRGHVFINPYTGAILGSKIGNPHHEFWSVVAEIHINLFLGKFGNILVTWGTVVFLIMLISGIILWWPKNRAAFRQRYKFSWKRTTKWKRKNYDLHNVLGFYACWIVVFMVVTGLMWSFEWFNNGMYYLTSGGQSLEMTLEDATHATQGTTSTMTYPFNTAHYVRSRAAFIQKYPDVYATTTELSIGYFANDRDSVLDISASYDPAGLRVSKALWGGYSKVSGRMMKDNWENSKNLGDELQMSTNELHYGTYYGVTSKIATFLACLVAASLPVTGFTVWWGRRNKRNGSKAIIAN